MQKLLVNDTSLENIASAIRSVNGKELTYKPKEMASAIEELYYPSGTFSITSDGVYPVKSYAYVDVSGGGTSIINQDKTVTPTLSIQSVTYDSGYTGLGTVTVNPITPVKSASDISAQLSSSGLVLDVSEGYYTNSDLTLPMSNVHITPLEAEQTIIPTAGTYGISTAHVAAISSSYVGTGVARKSATTYMPGTTDQTITSGQYLEGDQTILGDANLVPSNIALDVSIFGVTGTHGGGSEDPVQHVIYQNRSGVDVADSSRVKVLRLAFSMDSTSYLSIDMEFLMTTAATGPGSSASSIDSSSGTVTVSATIPTTEIVTEYWLNGTQLSGHIPEVTCIDGKHVLRIRHDELSVEEGSHVFEVYFTATGGEVTIPAYGITAWIEGSGLNSQPAWDGTITVTDAYTPLALQLATITDSTPVITKQTPTARTASDTYTPITLSLVTLTDGADLMLGLNVTPSSEYVSSQTVPTSSTVWQADANGQYVDLVAVTGLTGFASPTGQDLYYMASFDSGTTWQGWNGSAWVNDLHMDYSTISSITTWPGSVMIRAIFVNGQKCYGFFLKGVSI